MGLRHGFNRIGREEPDENKDFHHRCCIIHGATTVSSDSSTSRAQEIPASRSSRSLPCSALCVAALANVLVPTVFFSETHLFGQTSAKYRAMIALVVLGEYAIAFLLMLVHANVGFASGYAVATSAVVTLGSAGLAYLILRPAGWGWGALSVEIVVLAGLAFAVLSNVIFFVASVRYAHAIHPRLHLGGFLLGVAASFALLLLYARILA